VRLLVPLLLAACAMPPRTDDQSTPERAYETFRGAIARDEYRRAYGTLSDRLRGKLGLTSPGQFTDAMVVGGGMAVGAIRRSKAKGPVEPLPDGRALLRLKVRYLLLFGPDVSLWLRAVPVVKVWVEGKEAPEFYQHMDRLEVVREGDLLGVRLDPELLEELEEGVRRGQVRAFKAGFEWFLDDFEVGEKGK
jgi:hypothetical protein